MQEIILQYLYQYSPLACMIIMTIFTLAKTIRKFQEVDVNSPIAFFENRMNKKLDETINSFKSYCLEQNTINQQLHEQLLQAQEEANKAKEEAIELSNKLQEEFKAHRELLNKVITEDVEIKADLRRK